ncbi:N/A [soil metagenome]
MRRLTNQQGFTLIELLIVIVIIGILATIAMRVFWSAKDRGLEATLQSDLKTVAVHQETYYEENFTYSLDPDSLANFNTSPGVDLDITYAATDGWAGIVSSPSLANKRCGLLIGAAPSGSAGPATIPGRLHCGP